MIKTLITPQDVIDLAYAGAPYTPPSTITEADILAAQQRYITPVVGESLMESFANGEYTDLLEDYVVPALAEYVRIDCNSATAPATKRERQRAKVLLRLLSDHLEDNASSYPGYSSFDNVLNRCNCDGGFVQVL